MNFLVVSLRHYIPSPSPKNSPWQHHKAPAVLQEDPPTPKRAASEDKEMLADAFWFY